MSQTFPLPQQVRVYGVQKGNKWDMLDSRHVAAGTFPKTVTEVYVAWGDGKGDKSMRMDLQDFLAIYKHSHNIHWVAK
jgi:hypothetical protein